MNYSNYKKQYESLLRRLGLSRQVHGGNRCLNKIYGRYSFEIRLDRS